MSMGRSFVEIVRDPDRSELGPEVWRKWAEDLASSNVPIEGNLQQKGMLSCTSQQHFVSCLQDVLTLVSGISSVIIIRRLGMFCATGTLLTCPLFAL